MAVSVLFFAFKMNLRHLFAMSGLQNEGKDLSGNLAFASRMRGKVV
jgi:hypothetical protein